ncbi:MAG TPA: VWA domain-containing protein [Pyrinomonadaceae bacterium]
MSRARTPARLLASLACLACLYALSAGAAPQGPPPASAAASPTPVRVEVTLTGGKGRAAPEPKREDVRVYVDGAERPVVSFEKEEEPVSYGLVVDNSGSLRSQAAAVVGAAKFLVGRNRPGDEAFVVRFVSSDNIQLLQPLTSDARALGGALDSMRIQGGQTALLDALHLAGEHLVRNAKPAGSAARRLALVLVSDGEDRESSHKVEEVLRPLKAGGVRVYCVGMTGALDDERGFVTESKRRKAKDLLEKIATETGGRFYYAEKGPWLEEAVAEVSANMRARYFVGYEPPAAAGEAPGKVEVRLVGAPAKEKLRARVVEPAGGGE